MPKNKGKVRFTYPSLNTPPTLPHLSFADHVCCTFVFLKWKTWEYFFLYQDHITGNIRPC